ncbi:MAG: M23 family metallopeptidase [Cytophagaceae bacterium]|jgi:murein DD-endopeptidase MepM/ murein hydrolase activator NlpD|nr:M23 family metallopeptidase [Cytophagaceae bacterium]
MTEKNFFLTIACLSILAFAANNVSAQNMADNATVQSDLNQPSIYPLDSKNVKKIAAGYGERIDPVYKTKHFHAGIDFVVNEGENVVSTADGIVVEANYDSQKGNYVLIQHGEAFSTCYFHLKSLSVKAGDRLNRGQFIGYSGNTGKSTAPHLHYEVLKNSRNVNPQDYLPQ